MIFILYIKVVYEKERERERKWGERENIFFILIKWCFFYFKKKYLSKYNIVMWVFNGFIYLFCYK